ncbi:MAG: sulfur oxidation c-type cytochrome SoxA [Candidatus Binatia bacterium]
MRSKILWYAHWLLTLLSLPFVVWAEPHVVNSTIPAPLTKQPGDPERGRHIVLDRDQGDCTVCHAMPLPQRQFHGTVGPPLDGIGLRSTSAALRLRLVDPKVLNPQTVMPAYYKTTGLRRVLAQYAGKPILSAQEIEDVVAYLLTLKSPFSESQTPALQLHPPEESQYRVDGRRSGYTYLSEENQRLQNDEFANPGLLWVEQGKRLWGKVDGLAQKSCAACHGEATTSMRGVRTRYPRFDERTGKLMNLEQQINRCRTEHLQTESYPYESEDLLALTTFVGFQSRGMPLAVRIDGPVQPFFAAGRTFFLQRRGQLDLACTHCHDLNAGQRLRGDVVSQGQGNGFPIYRHTWQTLGSIQRMFVWCNAAVRAQPLPYGADGYVNLELYMAWRARGLPIETPAVRR